MSTGRFRECFIFVVGSTPQIVTETVFALSQRNPPVYPDEINVITTTTGKTKLEDALVNKGILARLCEDFGIPPLQLDSSRIKVVRDHEGSDLADIKTPEDNEALGNLVTALIREKTSDPAVRLHCSLAGGRKTMSFYLGAALQLFGRPWDRLYHVLVTPEFESNPHFFYKPRKNAVIECRMPDGSVAKLNTRDAEVHLAELPFVRLGGKLSLHAKSFQELVNEGQREIDVALIQPEVRVNLADRIVYVGETLVEMVPIQLMFYTMFLRQKTEQCKYPEQPYCLDCTGCYLTVAELTAREAVEEMAKDYERIYRGKALVREELLRKHSDGLDPQQVRTTITKISKSISEQLSDPALVPHYLITHDRKYAGTRYGVRVEKGKIRIE
jgi:CRISPR-associated protein Csx14